MRERPYWLNVFVLTDKFYRDNEQTPGDQRFVPILGRYRHQCQHSAESDAKACGTWSRVAYRIKVTPKPRLADERASPCATA
jgi:hypothetical protein